MTQQMSVGVRCVPGGGVRVATTTDSVPDAGNVAVDSTMGPAGTSVGVVDNADGSSADPVLNDRR